MNRQLLKIPLAVLLFLASLTLLGRGLGILDEALVTANLYLYDGRVKTITADAVVIGRRSAPGNSTNHSQEYATYRFSISAPGQDPVSLVDEDRIDGGTGRENLQVGDHVPIQYVSDHPFISEILGTNPKVKEDYLYSRFALPILLHLALGLLLLLLALVAVGSILRAKHHFPVSEAH
jgi:hypothetical protein